MVSWGECGSYCHSSMLPSLFGAIYSWLMFFGCPHIFWVFFLAGILELQVMDLKKRENFQCCFLSDDQSYSLVIWISFFLKVSRRRL